MNEYTYMVKPHVTLVAGRSKAETVCLVVCVYTRGDSLIL